MKEDITLKDIAQLQHDANYAFKKMKRWEKIYLSLKKELDANV